MARNGDLRFMIYPHLKISGFSFNNNSSFQLECQKAGNCFRTREEAQAMAYLIADLLKKRKCPVHKDFRCYCDKRLK